jgi:hypothetical protein
MIVARSGGMTSAKWERSDGIVALLMGLDGASRGICRASTSGAGRCS